MPCPFWHHVTLFSVGGCEEERLPHSHLQPESECYTGSALEAHGIGWKVQHEGPWHLQKTKHCTCLPKLFFGFAQHAWGMSPEENLSNVSEGME